MPRRVVGQVAQHPCQLRAVADDAGRYQLGDDLQAGGPAQTAGLLRHEVVDDEHLGGRGAGPNGRPPPPTGSPTPTPSPASPRRTCSASRTSSSTRSTRKPLTS